MEMTKLKVTPAIAQEWLETVNVSNRNFSHNLVKKYAKDMETGNWRNTHQNAIAFYEDGTLADGQHRLMAVVASGVRSVEMFIASGLSREDGSMIDQGRPRSVADALKIGGMLSNNTYVNYSVAIAKLIRAAEAHERKASMSISEVAKSVESLREGIDFSCSELSSVQGVGLKNATLRAAVATGYYHLPTSVIQRFSRVIVSGMPEGAKDETIIRLRNWLLMSGSTRSGTDRIDRYRTILKYLNAYYEGRPVKLIRVAKDNAFETGVFDNE